MWDAVRGGGPEGICRYFEGPRRRNAPRSPRPSGLRPGRSAASLPFSTISTYGLRRAPCIRSVLATTHHAPIYEIGSSLDARFSRCPALPLQSLLQPLPRTAPQRALCRFAAARKYPPMAIMFTARQTTSAPMHNPLRRGFFLAFARFLLPEMGWIDHSREQTGAVDFDERRGGQGDLLMRCAFWRQ